MRYSKVLSFFTGASILLLTLLIFKNSENIIGTQTLYLCNIIKILLCLTALQLISNYKDLKIGISDITATLLSAYLFINYETINPTIFDTKFAVISLLFPIYICLRIYSNSKALQNIIFYSFVISGIFLSTLSIKQILGIESSNHNLFKATATFYNPGQLGGYVAIILAGLTPYLLAEYKNFNYNLKTKNIFGVSKYLVALTSAILSAIILPSTGSRASFIALFVCAIIYVTINYGNKSIEWIKSHKITSLIATLAIFSSLIVGYTLKEDSANGRLLIWKTSLQNIDTKDIAFGVGCGNFAGKYGDYQELYFSDNKNIKEIAVVDAPEFAFNEYIQIFVEYGVVGLLLFLSIIYISLKNLYKHKDNLAYPLTALLVFAFFSYPFSLPVFLIILTAIIATSATYDKAIAHKIIYIVLFIISIFATYFSSKSIKKEAAAIVEWKKLSVYYNINAYKDLAKDYSTIYQELRDNQRFLFEYGQILSKTEEYQKSNTIMEEGVKVSSDPMFLNIIGNNYKSLKNYSLADKYYQRSFDRLPNRIYPLYLQMNLYKETNQKDLLRNKAQQILNFKEKVTSSATKSIKTEAKECLENLKD